MDPLRAAGLISSDEEEDEDNKTGSLPTLANEGNSEGMAPQKRKHDDEDSDDEDSMDLKRTRQVISDSD